MINPCNPLEPYLLKFVLLLTVVGPVWPILHRLLSLICFAVLFCFFCDVFYVDIRCYEICFYGTIRG